MANPLRQPLSHHEILGPIDPYTRSGWQLDLPASDRLARRLLLRPVPARLQDEHLLLERLATGSWQLATGNWQWTRICTHASGLRATVQLLGTPAGALLAGVAAVPAEWHFRSGPGIGVAGSYRVSAGGAVVLEEGQVHIASGGPVLKLTMTVSAVRGVAADIKLRAPQEQLALPPDLLAVQSWSWTRLLPLKPAAYHLPTLAPPPWPRRSVAVDWRETVPGA